LTADRRAARGTRRQRIAFFIGFDDAIATRWRAVVVVRGVAVRRTAAVSVGTRRHCRRVHARRCARSTVFQSSKLTPDRRTGRWARRERIARLAELDDAVSAYGEASVAHARVSIVLRFRIVALSFARVRVAFSHAGRRVGYRVFWYATVVGAGFASGRATG